MRILFIGDLSGNNGPANVNKYLCDSTDKITFWNTKNRNVLYFIKYLFILLRTNVLIISSNYRANYYIFNLSKLMRKKTIYLMHGYASFEAKVNGSSNYKSITNRETKLLNKVDLILPVSKNYRSFFLSKRPEYREKTHYLTSGIKLPKNQASKDKIRNSYERKGVVVCGANRNIKRNSTVCKAIEILNRASKDYRLDIYGLMYPGNEKLPQNNYIKIHGRVSRDELENRLSKTKLFILNTEVESFGLSVIDALMCGCSVLISKNAGITSILNLTENDTIYDCNNENEIAQKIKYLYRHPNNLRVLKSLNFEYYTWDKVANRLVQISKNLYEGKGIKLLNNYE